MENHVSNCMIEFEAIVNHSLQQRGLEAVKTSLPQLQEGEK
jgi:hypothetical protein